MIPTNDLHAFAKYKFLRTIRQSDGATLTATRVVPNEGRPIYWDVDENDPKPFKTPVLNSEGPYSTSQLNPMAEEKGYYSGWNPMPEDVEPDTEDYPVD